MTSQEAASSKISFILKHPHFETIQEVHFHFLTAEDCYSGYYGLYTRVESLSEAFEVPSPAGFFLSEPGLYQALSCAVGEDKVSSVRSVLLRFIAPNRHFAWFSGGCNDQDINCCVPIFCSQTAERCSLLRDMGEQRIDFNL